MTIALEDVAARRAPLALAGLSLAFEAGAHALLGARQDGGPLVLALLAGAARARSGRVRVLGTSPDDPHTRSRIAYVPLDPALPDALRVDEVLRLAARLRGDPPRDAIERLAPLGVSALALRSVGSLSRPEIRAVALAEAVTSPSVTVLLVDEPFILLDPRAEAGVADALRDKARDGGVVVCATASRRDAFAVATDAIVLREGVAVSGGAPVSLTPEGVAAMLVVVTASIDDARGLASDLARQPSDAVDAIEQGGPIVRVRGKDAVAAARVIGAAVARAGVDVLDLRCETFEAAPHE